MDHPLDIGVVGCGTAGGAAALLLARAGHSVTVYEAVEEPRPVGAGIMIQPTGMSVLARLGLLEHALARGARVERLRCQTRSGRSVIDLSYADIHPDAFGLGLHRGVLFAALFDAVQREPSITLRCGTPVEDSAGAKERRAVLAKDGTELGAWWSRTARARSCATTPPSRGARPSTRGARCGSSARIPSAPSTPSSTKRSKAPNTCSVCFRRASDRAAMSRS
jgi:2-polyprenyl-6-methoxyphenol hydroxylase-like FAD-dependent oxidoreductase